MRQRTLTLLLAVVFVPAFVIACAGGNKEGSAEDAMDEPANRAAFALIGHQMTSA